MAVKTPKNGLKAIAKAKWELENAAKRDAFVKSISKESK
jgi:hypothetical protein